MNNEMDKEEIKMLEDINSWIEASDDDETIKNLLFEKCNILRDFIEKRNRRIDYLESCINNKE